MTATWIIGDSEADGLQMKGLISRHKHALALEILGVARWSRRGTMCRSVRSDLGIRILGEDPGEEEIILSSC